MAQSHSSDTFVVEGVVLSYPNLFAPRQVAGKGEPVYSAKLYLPPDAAAIISQKMQELAGTAFVSGETQNPNFRWPIAAVSGADLQNPRFNGFFVGNAKANADYPPQVIDQNRQPVMDRGQIYAGVIAAVGIRLYSYNNMGNVGISMGLMAVMKTQDGEHLVASTDVNALFGGVQAAPTQPGTVPMPGGAPTPVAPPAAPAPGADATPPMPTVPFPQ